MHYKKAAYSLLSFFIGCLLLQYNTGCLKEEYSYEGGPLRDTTTNTDTTLVTDTTILQDSVTVTDTSLTFPDCAFCKYATSLTMDQWNFRYDTFFLCGTISNAVMTPEKNAFTFFGPSSCTPGTGLIITAFFDPVTFDTDRAGIVSTQVTIQYYNNNGPKDIFISGPGTTFSITVNQYEQQSRTAIGRFSGTALTEHGKIVPITAGNFKIQFQ